jgi:hypothetical protein
MTKKCWACGEEKEETIKHEISPGHWVNVCKPCELVSGLREGK